MWLHPFDQKRKLQLGSLALNLHKSPSDIIDPFREELWGENRINFDIECTNKAVRMANPKTTKDKVENLYNELDIEEKYKDGRK